jgi:hypothetical protein
MAVEADAKLALRGSGAQNLRVERRGRSNLLPRCARRRPRSASVGTLGRDFRPFTRSPPRRGPSHRRSGATAFLRLGVHR